MRKLTYTLLLAAIALSFVACDKDDDKLVSSTDFHELNDILHNTRWIAVDGKDSVNVEFDFDSDTQIFYYRWYKKENGVYKYSDFDNYSSAQIYEEQYKSGEIQYRMKASDGDTHMGDGVYYSGSSKTVRIDYDKSDNKLIIYALDKRKGKKLTFTSYDEFYPKYVTGGPGRFSNENWSTANSTDSISLKAYAYSSTKPNNLVYEEYKIENGKWKLKDKIALDNQIIPYTQQFSKDKEEYYLHVYYKGTYETKERYRYEYEDISWKEKYLTLYDFPKKGNKLELKYLK